MPQLRVTARENRQFLRRAVRFVASQGVTQFIDIGSGLPTVENTHEVAQAVNPDARVAYIDYDEVVLAHARALLSEDENVIASRWRERPASRAESLGVGYRVVVTRYHTPSSP